MSGMILPSDEVEEERDEHGIRHFKHATPEQRQSMIDTHLFFQRMATWMDPRYVEPGA